MPADAPIDQLREYYEAEAADGSRELRTEGRRADLCNDFLASLDGNRVRTVVDIGAGPASDGVGFEAAGIRSIGVDLAVGNARRARALGVTVLPGSALALPFAADSFDAAWSMSTLMHLDDHETMAAVSEIKRVCRPGAPALISQWGGPPQVILGGEANRPSLVRRFVHRPIERNLELLAPLGEVVHHECWDDVDHGWEYHVVRLRIT